MVAMLIEWIVHRCRKIQLVLRRIWGRGQFPGDYSEGYITNVSYVDWIGSASLLQGSVNEEDIRGRGQYPNDYSEGYN